eukprot:gene10587-7355_t
MKRRLAGKEKHEAVRHNTAGLLILSPFFVLPPLSLTHCVRKRLIKQHSYTPQAKRRQQQRLEMMMEADNSGGDLFYFAFLPSLRVFPRSQRDLLDYLNHLSFLFPSCGFVWHFIWANLGDRRFSLTCMLRNKFCDGPSPSLFLSFFSVRSY